MAQSITRKLVIKHRLVANEVTEVSKYEHFFRVSHRETSICLDTSISVQVPEPSGAGKPRSFRYRIRRRFISLSGAVLKQNVECGHLSSGFYPNLWLDFPVTILLVNKYPPDPYVEMDVHIQITGVFSTDGEERIPTRDFSQPDQITDAVLLVKGKRFHVSKAALAWNSWYFSTLFTGGFKESNKNEIELKDVSANCFQHILECMCGLSNIDENAVHEVLKMADLWQIPSATKACQQFLIEESNITDEEKKKLAETYKLAKLKALCEKRSDE